MTKTTRMTHDEQFRQLVEDSDDIEIIEVVGLDEDSPAASAVFDEEEIVLDLSDDPESDPLEVAAVSRPEAAETETTPDDVRTNTDAVAPLRAIALREKFQRLQADFENFKRRTEREKDRCEAQAAATLVRRMLPVLDNFERALALESRPDNEAALRDGVVLIFRQILDELRKEGLDALEVVGQNFDPCAHHAVETDSDSGYPPNVVVEELQRGYRLGEQLLRPALVRVSVDAADGQGEGQ